MSLTPFSQGRKIDARHILALMSQQAGHMPAGGVLVHSLLAAGKILLDRICMAQAVAGQRTMSVSDLHGVTVPVEKALKAVDRKVGRGTKTLGVIQVDESVWKKLTREEKQEIERICDEKLEQYYSRLF
nr:hypothetical protein [uncultured Agathobaculum sp.]